MVVFDAGGVLVRICRSWREACAAAGVAFHEPVATPEGMAARKAVVQRYELGRLSCEEYFETLAAATNGMYAPAEVRRVHESWILGDYPGVAALIEGLGARGVRTGLLSNTNATHWRDLIGRRSIQLIDHPHASHLLGMAKPAAEIYHAFAARVGRPAGELLFFDDLAENVAAARAAGWRAVQVDHTGDPSAQMHRALADIGIAV